MAFLPSRDNTVNDCFDFRYEDIQDVGEFPEFALGWPDGMADGYDKGQLVFVIHIGLWSPEGEVRALCATFYRADMETDAGWNDRGRNDNSGGSFKTELPLSHIGDDYIEQPVLVNIVEFAEEPKKGRKFSVPSIVRLRSLNACLRLCAEESEPPLYLPSKFFWGVCDRELQSIKVGRWIRSAFFDSERIDSAIESGTEVVDAIAGEERPVVERGRLRNVDDQTVACAVSVTLAGDDVRIGIFPRSKFGLDSIEVFFGTANFQEAAGELRSDHAYFLSGKRRLYSRLCATTLLKGRFAGTAQVVESRGNVT